MKRQNSLYVTTSIVALALAMGPSRALADSAVWNGSSGSDWMTPDNWSGLPVGQLPGSGDTVLVQSPSGTFTSRLGTSGQEIQSLAVGSPSAAGVLEILSGGGLTALGAFTVGSTFAPSSFFISGTGTFAATGASSVGGAVGDGTLAVISGGTFLNTGPLSVGGASGMGTGLFRIAGGASATVTDTITLNETGRLLIGGTGAPSTAGALSAGGIAFNGGVLEFNHTATTAAPYSLSAPLSGSSGTLRNTAGATLLTGDGSAFSGATDVAGGTLILGNTLGGSASVASGAKLQIGNGGASGAFTGDIASSGTVAFDRDGTLVHAGVISGTGAVSVAGPGTVVLTGANTYSGGTTISAGTLQIGNGGTSGAIVGNVANSGVLAFNRSDDVTFAGQVSGTGSLEQRGTGMLSLIGSNSYTGGTTISAGALQIGNGGTTGSIVGNVANSGILAFNRSDDVTFSGVVSGTGALEQRGSGTTTLTGASTYTGGTTIAAGTLQVGNGGTSGSIVGNVANSGVLAFNRSDAVTFAGIVSGTGALEQRGAGTLTLTGANSYTGGTTIAAGTLQVGNGGTSGSIVGNVANSGVLAFNRSDDVTFAGIVSGTGALEQRGAGALTLTGANTYTGGTAITAGRVKVSSDANLGAASGMVSLSNGGVLEVDGTSFTATVRDFALGTGGGAVDVANAANTLTASGVLSGASTFHKAGAGTLALTGDSSAFAGTTSVDAGTLNVDGKLGGAVNVGTARLGGSGTIGGAVTVADGGTLVGVQGQTLTMGALSLSAGSTIAAGLGDPAAASASAGLFNVNGDLTLDGKVDVTDVGGFGPGVYRLINYSGGLTNNGLDVGTTPAGFDLLVQTSVAQQVNLVADSQNAPVRFWNGTTTSPTGTVEGGDGTWTAGPQTNWTDANGLFSKAWSESFAIFQSAPGTVTVSNANGQVSANGMQFAVDGYRVVGDPILLTTASGSPIIRVGDGSAAGAGYKATIGSVLTGTNGMTKTDLGTLILTGENTYTGGTHVAQGTLQLGDGGTTGSIQGDVAVDGTLIFNRSNLYTFAGVISGAGNVWQVGSGTTVLTGDSSGFTGTTGIQAGTLQVDGALGGTLNVLSGGILDGTGTVGSTTVASGGRVRVAGDGIGTLGVNGNILFASGSIYQVNVTAAGQSDRITATGGATIEGGTVDVRAGSGTYQDQTKYTILTADGGVTRAGANQGFDGATSNLAFLDPSLEYDANNVYLVMTRNDQSFCLNGSSQNACNAGKGTESLGAGNQVYDAVLQLDEEDAASAFNQLSGGIHASAQSVILNDSAFVRTAVFDRLASAFDGPGSGGYPNGSGRGGNGMVDYRIGEGVVLWGQAFGSWGRFGATPSASSVDRNIGGFFTGADMLVADWRVGALGGYSRSSFRTNSVTSSGTANNYTAGIYGGRQWGPLGLGLGAAYTYSDVDTQRTVAFPGYYDYLTAGYGAQTTQLFGELGYKLHQAAFTFEPFLNLAYVQVNTDGFIERGGAAALVGKAASDGMGFSTLGLRASGPVYTYGTTVVSARGLLGWRYGFGDGDPITTMSIVGGGTPFAITGVAADGSSAVVELGLDAALTRSFTAGLSYTGQWGDAITDNGLLANAKWSF